MADSKLSALSELSIVDLLDYTYLVDNTGPTSYRLGTARLFGLAGLTPGGRLTLTTAVPVTTSDVIGAGTLYYTPYLHDRIRIFDGTRWIYYTFTEKSLALTLTSDKNYDVFIYDNAGTLTLELSAAWTNDTARADALTTQDSVQVKSGATTRLWLGTIRASGTNTTEDSGGGVTTQVGGKRFVWNAYNQARRHLQVFDSTNTWSYTTNTIRQAGGATGNKVEYVTGNIATLVTADLRACVVLSGNVGLAAKVGVGVDSITAFSGHRQEGYNDATSTLTTALGANYSGYPGLGYHYIAWLEKGADGGSTFLGDNGADGSQMGLIVSLDN